MFTIVIISILIQAVYTTIVFDDLPVLEYLGCGECPRSYVPVCGKDKRTYVNACRLNCLNSKRKKEDWVFIDRYGPCVEYSAVFEAKGF